MTTENIFRILCGAAVFIMAVYYIKREHKLRSLIFGGLTGFAALVIINKYGGMIGADIPLNIFNIVGSSILGVPFVICLVILTQI